MIKGGTTQLQKCLASARTTMMNAHFSTVWIYHGAGEYWWIERDSSALRRLRIVCVIHNREEPDE